VDYWNSTTRLRAPNADPLRRWADMEGKSPTMSEDLYQQCTETGAPHRDTSALFGASGKLFVAILHAWAAAAKALH
jgi:hypothetical protein